MNYQIFTIVNACDFILITYYFISLITIASDVQEID